MVSFAIIYSLPLFSFYEDFIETYMMELFKDIEDRKNGTKDNKIITISTLNTKLKNTLVKWTSKYEYPVEITWFVNEFVNNLNKDQFTKNEIRQYVLRLYRNKKDIKILDIKNKYWLDINIFTDEFIKKAEKIWLNFQSEIIQDFAIIQNPIKNQTIEKTEFINVFKEETLNYQQILIKQAQDYLNELDIFDVDQCIKAFKIMGYSFINENAFIKQFNKLYPDKIEKERAYQELKKNIGIINKKKIYNCRTIEMHSWIRILLLMNENIVDGVYNHDDYENRIVNMK